jgi:hypothetical protein
MEIKGIFEEILVKLPKFEENRNLHIQEAQ